MPTPTPTIAVLAAGQPNAQSLVTALNTAGATASLTHSAQEIANADGLVVLGVGGFTEVMTHIKAARADEQIERRLAGGRKVLAIGVGMHILFDRASEDGADVEGLGEWPGTVVRLDAPEIPHRGLSPIEPAPGSTLFEGIENEKYWFDHSLAVTEWTLEVYGAFQPPRVSWATHGQRFVAAVENGPLTATQFHPEESGEAGVQLLRNWLNTL